MTNFKLRSKFKNFKLQRVAYHASYDILDIKSRSILDALATHIWLCCDSRKIWMYKITVRTISAIFYK